MKHPRQKPKHTRRASFRRPSRCRRGLTLFELLLALAIFLMSLAALAHLINAGSRAAIQGRLQTQAILRCESKLAEVLAGIEPMESTADEPFPDDADWRWTLQVEPGPGPSLLELKLAVSHKGNSALATTTYQLQRYARHPQMFRTRLLEEAVRPPRRDEPATTPVVEQTPQAGDQDQ